jgi:hypothetical protein
LPILSTFLVLSLTACDSTKKIEVISSPIERVPLNLPPVDRVTLDEIEWILITPDNAEKVWADIEKKKYDIVLFGLTDRGYESLSVNIAKLKQLVTQQKAVIASYKRYYEDQNTAIKNQEKDVEEKKKEAEATPTESNFGSTIKSFFK